jgi:ABC-2 type transport system permease protein
MTTATRADARATPPWRVVAERDLRDLWLAGRGLPLLVGYAVLLSITSYLTASNRALNFLEQREVVGQTLQIATAVAALLVLIHAADSISGERDRDTLETLLITPASKHALLVGKAAAALSLWAAAYLVSVPYVVYLGRGTRVTVAALVGGLVVGLLLALFSCGLGLLLSIVSSSSRLSLSASIFVLLALFAPTQIPSSARQAWFGGFLLRADPFTAGLRYLGRVIVWGESVMHPVGWLVGPAVGAVLLPALALFVGRRLALQPGDHR